MVSFLSSLLTFGFDTASPLRFWHAVFAFSYGTLGLLANWLLLWLVKRCKHSELAVYSRILVTNSYIDIVFLVISVMARYGENMVVPDSPTEFTYGYGVLNWEIFQWTPTIVNYVIAFAWLISLYYSQWSIAIQFLYRYCIVVHGTTLTYFQYGMCLLAVLLLELPLWGVMVYNSYGRTMQLEFIKNPNQTALLNGIAAGDPKDAIGPVRICWYNFNVNSELFQIWSWFHFGYLIAFYVVICFCAAAIFWTIHVHIKRSTMVSSVGGVNETSKQITTVLCIQSLLPLFFAYAPTIYLKLTNLFGATPFFASFGLLLGMWNPWLSVVNPIICILCIRRYRKKCWSMFGKYFSGLKQQSSTANNSRVSPGGPIRPGQHPPMAISMRTIRTISPNGRLA